MAVIMAKDEQTSRCSNGSSSGGGDGGGGGSSHRSSKKLKHKKVPQRGMGVAQLEKIISEQRQKNQNPQSHGLDHPRFTAGFTANLGGFSYESNPPFWSPAPNLMLQRSQQLQQPFSSSMVNVPTGTSSTSSSSVLNFQMEPPSNQSYYGNNYHPLWQEEEKMVGMKRPYPFLLENRPMPSFHGRFPSAYVSPISGSDESASCGNGGTTSIELAHPYFRENASSSSAKSDAITMKFIEENQVLSRDFLKLAPPQAPQSNSSLKEKLYQNDQSEDPSHLSGKGGSNLPPFHGFFPAATTPMEQPENSNCEAEESVDLNLKL
ncbi:putative SPEAR family protein [Helianthus annuus]|nr:putative SPEAR family protein [Helianthus annuus]